MGMYDTINSEQVKCFPWITYQYIKDSDIRLLEHGGSLKNYENNDAVPEYTYLDVNAMTDTDVQELIHDTIHNLQTT